MIKYTKVTTKTKPKNGLYLVKRNDELSTKVGAVPYDIMRCKNGKWYNDFDLAYHYPRKCVTEFALLKLH